MYAAGCVGHRVLLFVAGAGTSGLIGTVQTLKHGVQAVGQQGSTEAKWEETVLHPGKKAVAGGDKRGNMAP